MRSRACPDGRRRILAKVEIPLDIDMIAQFSLAHPSMIGDDAMNRFQSLNKRQLFGLAKETIRMYGSEYPANIVEERWRDQQVARAREHVAALFPEVD